MPVATIPRPIRLAPEEWDAFRQFQAELQRRTPHATVTARDAFRVAVGSASAALAAGHLAAGPPWVALAASSLPLGSFDPEDPAT